MSWIWILIVGIVILILIIGLILYFIYRNNQVQKVLPQVRNVPSVSNNIMRDYRPYKVIGARDGSWFQVLDKQGDIVASFSTPETLSPNGTPVYTFEAECPQGQVELVGIRSSPDGERIGPVGCAVQATDTSPPQIQYVGTEGNIERLYSLGRIPLSNSSMSSTCPSGFQRLMSSDGVTGQQIGNNAERLGMGIQYICVPEGECKFHRDCPDGTICSGGNCISVENIADF